MTKKDTHLSIVQLAQILETNRTYIHRLVSEGMPFVWRNKRRRFSLAAVMVWLRVTRRLKLYWRFLGVKRPPKRLYVSTDVMNMSFAEISKLTDEFNESADASMATFEELSKATEEMYSEMQDIDMSDMCFTTGKTIDALKRSLQKLQGRIISKLSDSEKSNSTIKAIVSNEVQELIAELK